MGTVRLPAGLVLALFEAGATIDGLSRMFDVTTDRIEEALRRHMARRSRPKKKRR